MAILLVGVHGAAEAEHGVVAGRDRSGGDVGLGTHPRVELDAPRGDRVGEDARAGVALVDDRQGAHATQSASARANATLAPRRGSAPAELGVQLLEACCRTAAPAAPPGLEGPDGRLPRGRAMP